MKPCLMSFNQRMLPVGGRITVRLVSSLTRLGFTKKRKYLCLCSESVETKPVKLETSHKVILHNNSECSTHVQTISYSYSIIGTSLALFALIPKSNI